jgi:hypothetical protein
MQVVDFVARGLDGDGRPSQALLEVTEAAVVTPKGRVLGRFRYAETLGPFLFRVRGRVRLVAVETVGVPRFDLSGRFICSLAGRKRPKPKRSPGR